MDTEETSRMKLNKEQPGDIGLSHWHLYVRNDPSGPKSDFPKLETLEYNSLET